jgi:hypothetical protein
MCCGKGKKANMNVPEATRSIVIPPAGANGMILLSYAGRGLARSFYGPVTGTMYRFSESKRKFGYVAEEDAPKMLQLKDGGKFLFSVVAQVKEEDVQAVEEILNKDMAFIDAQEKAAIEAVLNPPDTFAGLESVVTANPETPMVEETPDEYPVEVAKTPVKRVYKKKAA